MHSPIRYLLLLPCLVTAAPAEAQTLAAAIADALANAPAVAEGTAGVAAAEARLDRARSEGNPLLRVEGSAGTGRIDNRGFFGINAGNTTPLALQGTAEMPLYTGGRVAAGIKQAKGGVQIATLQAEETRLETVVQAVSAYAAVLSTRKLESRYGQLVHELREIERQADLRYQAGEISKPEVAQARARRAEGESGMAQAEGRRVSAEAAFERLTGKAPGELSPFNSLPRTPASLDEAMDMARTRNPSIRQAEQAISVARAGVRASKAEGLPSIGAYAEATHVRDQFFPDYKADSIAVGIRGRWTLFAGRRVASQVRAADAELLGAQARARQVRLNLDGMVVDAWQGLVVAGKTVDASRLRQEAMVEALRGRRLEAQVGSVPTLAVLDAEREAIEAEAALIEAEGQRQVAAWRINALTGNLESH
jgi:outer membrane protein